MSRKIVCHLTSAHLLSDTRIFYKQCRTLAGAGYQVSLIAQNDRDEVLDGIHIKGITKAKNRRDRMLNLTKQVYNRALECDAHIYHFHDPELIPIGLRLKRLGKTVIYDVHEDVPRQILSKSWIPSPLRNTASNLTERTENFAAKKFDAIVTATDFIADRFRVLNDNVVSVQNFPQIMERPTQLKPTIPKNQICYISSHLSIERAIVPIVESMKYIDAELVLAGRMTDSVRETVESIDGWAKTIYLGYVNQEQVRVIMRESKVGLALFALEPNYVNALPTKMFEYMREGIPVVVTDIPILKHIIEKHECGVLVSNLDRVDISDAVNLLLTDDNKLSEMGARGRNAVDTEYNWGVEADKLLKLYSELSTKKISEQGH